MKVLNVAIVGNGRIGKLHAENILYRLPEFNLVKVADPFFDDAWCKEHIVIATKDVASIFTDEQIDIFLICTPSSFHTEHINLAAKNGKHIFCEKPIGLNEADIIDAIKMAEYCDVKLQVGFNRRFDTDFAHIKHQIKVKGLGEPHIIRITSRDPDCPPEEYIKNSGGIFMDMSIHDFDMARFLAGSEVVEVFAMGQNLIDPVFKKYDDYDTAVINLKFANGGLGVIDNSRKAVYGYDQRIEVFSNKGCLRTKNLLEHNVVFSGEHQVETAKPLCFFLERYRDAFIYQLKSFHAAIVNNEKPMVDGFDGLQAIRIARAAKESAKNNIPVKVATSL
ncbi:inositol 2-dehydrogenase [Shewanella surugensis]|uniref:Inositol 2-dehydrogenase n=1 Tax=Shewanella surugensis TaxID=212020 RepID=A0ABT0LI97_9GAMM|nr:inositol 2-dehydrogenase [Shewanella surugensis]MCL1127314.1 inositol 2-dehydrogenase [Shewanella surugensis]